MIFLDTLQRAINRAKLSTNPDSIDALLDTMTDIGAAFYRVEHGAACYRRQNANRPWNDNEKG